MSEKKLYLVVPVGEAHEVRKLGAIWDRTAKRWYVVPGDDLSAFSRWIPYTQGHPLNIISDSMHIGNIQVPCEHCGSPTGVIRLYGLDGLVNGMPTGAFKCVKVTALEPSLKQLLMRQFPPFHQVSAEDSIEEQPSGRQAAYRNHCEFCGLAQGEAYLDQQWQSFAREYCDTSVYVGFTVTAIAGTVRAGGEVLFVKWREQGSGRGSSRRYS